MANHLRIDNLIIRNIHKKHTAKLNARFQRKISRIIKVERARLKKVNTMGISKFATDEYSIMDRRVRFLTVIYSVEGLDAKVALEAAARLKKELIKVIKRIKGATCLGALEIEVISIRNMRRLNEIYKNDVIVDPISLSATELKGIQIEDDKIVPTAVKEYRKLDVCEGLGNHLDESILAGESGQLLVHFHGLVTVTKESQFDDVLNALNEIPRLTIKPRQIRLQKMRRTHCGIPKAIKLSLEHLARYFTKGGNDFKDGKSYLQYKIKLPDDAPLTYDEQLLEWDHSEHEEDVVLEDGSIKPNSCSFNNFKNSKINILSLSVHEINVLAKVIHEMMNWNTTGTGYLVTVGRW